MNGTRKWHSKMPNFAELFANFKTTYAGSGSARVEPLGSLLGNTHLMVDLSDRNIASGTKENHCRNRRLAQLGNFLQGTREEQLPPACRPWRSMKRHDVQR